MSQILGDRSQSASWQRKGEGSEGRGKRYCKDAGGVERAWSNQTTANILECPQGRVGSFRESGEPGFGSLFCQVGDPGQFP